MRTCAHALWVDQQQLAVLRQNIGEQQLLGNQPRQPTFHAIEVGAIGQPVPVFAAPCLCGHKRSRHVLYFVSYLQLARREDSCNFDCVRAALIVDIEMCQSIHLIAPQINSNGCVGGRGEHVDDRTAPRNFAAVLHKLFTAITTVHKPRKQCIGIDFVAWSHNDWFQCRCIGPKFLQQCADRADDYFGRLVATNTPQHFKPAAHCLNTWAYAFEGECFPCGEYEHVGGPKKLHEVVMQQLRGGARWRCNDHCGFWRTHRERGDNCCASLFAAGQQRVLSTKRGQCTLLACKKGEV